MEGNSPSDAFVLDLEELHILECSMLIRLAPPLTSFINLSSLLVKDCDGLIYLMTSFTAKSLVHLTSLSASNCEKLKEVVMTNGEELEEEINFESLKSLELSSLSSFKCFCSGKHTFIFPSLVVLKVTGCHKMQNFSSGFIVAPFLKFVVVENEKRCWKESLNITINQMFLDKAIAEEVERDNEESSSGSQRHETSASTSRASNSEEHGALSKASEIVDSGKQQIHKLPIPHSGIDAHKMREITELPLDQVSQNTLSLPKVDAASGAEEANATLQMSFAKSVENTSTHISVQETEKSHDSDIRTQKMHEKFKTPQIQAAQNEINPIMVHNAATTTRGMVQAAQDALDSNIEKDMFNQTNSSVIVDKGETIGNQDMDENINKPLIQIDQDKIRLATIQNTEESHVSKIVPSENLSNSPATSVIGDTKQTIGTQDIDDTIDKDGGSLSKAQNSGMCDTIKKLSSQAPRNVLKSTTIENIEKSPGPETLPNESLPSQTSNYTEYTTTIDPSTSRAPEPMTSSMLASNADSNYKWMIDTSVQNLPYLEAGVKCHPQVLDWFNTKRRRVFASVFTEVTRILRSTRRRDLTEDDRNYIRECCTALEAVGFDGSWLSYVHGCIESCVDGDELSRKLKEAEAKASTLRTELASAEASLVSLRHEASKLDHFIEQ
ncbi:uncharacterized protein LOC129288187 isoform X2 [Prosopis cineraria]|uniref:uncharacterized protein LOC129288187 isoform X2 n=1 Tax=Prosopis cineraria TaxID=364024 RepID=UPI0024108DA0|nr:uncharacterized protein LOC129288187 isoform X2 [Prosopis cineraria]